MVIFGDADWGYIPGFLDEDDPRPAREQIDARSPGGWHALPPQLRFDSETLIMTYPGDPPFEPVGLLMFRDERLLLYPGDFVVIVQRDGSWEGARLD